ncbi:hypothetical protein [Sphingobium aromaticiconvertens]|uniref:hypothetical protein n=1 Tax=Sphingobium aromaticiconvertens TaxID=365341 RepID=UPI003015B011
MTHWYEHWSAQLGVRAGGLALLATARMEGGVLDRLVVDPIAAQGAGALLLAALLFVSASLGMALTIVGPGLWKPVRLSARWQDADPSKSPLLPR